MKNNEILEQHTLADLRAEWTHREEAGQEKGWHIFNSETLIDLGDGQQHESNARFICLAVNSHDALVGALRRIVSFFDKSKFEYESSMIREARAALALVEEKGEKTK